MNLADRAYMEEASRLGQQKDPYMQQMMMSSGPPPPNEMSSNLDNARLGLQMATGATEMAESAEDAGNLDTQLPLSNQYTGFPGRLNVAQSPAAKVTLDEADAVLALLEQSRNQPNPMYRGNEP
mgnify:FL=1